MIVVVNVLAQLLNELCFMRQGWEGFISDMICYLVLVGGGVFPHPVPPSAWSSSPTLLTGCLYLRCSMSEAACSIIIFDNLHLQIR